MSILALQNVRATLPARILSFALGYALVGVLGLGLFDVPQEFSGIWPAAGFATAVLLKADRRLWPGIPLGFLLIHGFNTRFPFDASLPQPMMAPPLVGAVAETLQAGLAVVLINRKFGRDPVRLTSKRDWLQLALYVGPLSCAISAALGSLGLHLANFTTNGPLWQTLLSWWVGDMLGVLLVLPSVLLWPTTRKLKLHSRGHPLSTMSRMTASAISVGLILTFALAHAIKTTDATKNRMLFNGAVDRGEAHLLHEYVSFKAVLNAAVVGFAQEPENPMPGMSKFRSPDTVYSLIGMDGYGLIQVRPSATSRQFPPEVQFLRGGQNLGERHFELTAEGHELRGLKLQLGKEAQDAAVKSFETGEAQLAAVTLSAPGRSPVPRIIVLQAVFDADTAGDTPTLIGWAFLLVSPEKIFGKEIETEADGAYLALVSINDRSGAADHFIPIYDRGIENHTARFRTSNTLEAFGQNWRFAWRSTPWFEAITAEMTAVFVLYGGLLLVAMAAGLIEALSEREKKFRDALHLAEKREQELITLTENAPVAMSVVSRDGRFLTVNDAFCAFVGYPEDAIVGVNFRELPTIKVIEGLAGELTDLLSGKMKSIVLEQHYVRPNGEEVDGILTASVLHSSSQRDPELVIQILDITEQKDLERMKGDFVATVSHELRTPLASISGSIALILATMADDVPDKVRQMLDIAQRNARRLGSLVNDLLDMQKIAAGNIELDNVEADVGEILREVVSENDAYAESFGVRFKLILPDAPLSASIDVNRFKQVMANLMSNAAKFSPKDSQIAIELERGTGRHRKFARVSVTDHGRGIPSMFHNRIFKPFSQIAPSSTRDREGTGLGLVISKEIVEKMGGTIGFDSEPDVSTTFWFRFPIGDST